MADTHTTINVDCRGTFTDCFVVCDGRVFTQKNATAHYNFSVGLLKALKGVFTQCGRKRSICGRQKFRSGGTGSNSCPYPGVRSLASAHDWYPRSSPLPAANMWVDSPQN